tara:strand:- start:100 stop:615 length:516 start_codon:yes stop_codon:yes gene_type:complete
MIYLNIGSNLSSLFGNKIDNIAKSISLLKKLNIKIFDISNIYQTPSYPIRSFPKFNNVTIKLESSMKLNDFFIEIKKIEKKIGRIKSPKNQPRVCDIDIIDYNGLILTNSNLQIPHPRMHKRNFVLYPLKDVSPEWQHPIFKKKIDYFLNQLNQKAHIEITRLNKNDIFKI